MHDQPAAGAASLSLMGILFVNLATVCWATNFTAARWVHAEVGPFTLSAVRYSIATIALAFMLRRFETGQIKPGKDIWLLLVMGIGGIAAFSGLVYWGLHFTTASYGALINGLGPVITAVWASMLIKEPLTRRQMLGAAASLVGVAVLISRGQASFFTDFVVNRGDIMVLIAVALWGLYSVIGRHLMRRRGRSPLVITALAIFIALPFLWAGAIWEMASGNLPTLSLKLVLVMIYLGLVPSMLGQWAWNVGVGRLGAGGAMVLYNTLPLYGAALGALFLGEALGPAYLAGGALILAGGLWAAWPRKTKT